MTDWHAAESAFVTAGTRQRVLPGRIVVTWLHWRPAGSRDLGPWRYIDLWRGCVEPRSAPGQRASGGGAGAVGHSVLYLNVTVILRFVSEYMVELFLQTFFRGNWRMIAVELF